LPDAVLVLDARDRVVDLNPAARQLAGSPAATAVGRPLSQVLTSWPTPRPTAFDPPAAVVVEGNGEQRYFDVRASDLNANQRTRVGRLVVLRDITELRHAAHRQEELVREQEARAAAERAAARSAILRALAVTLAHAQTEQDVAGTLLRTTTALLEARGGSIALTA